MRYLAHTIWVLLLIACALILAILPVFLFSGCTSLEREYRHQPLKPYPPAELSR